MKVELTFSDTDKFIKDITNGSSDLIAAKVAAEAKSGCHVIRGQLRNSIMWRSRIREGGFNTGTKEKAPSDSKITPIPDDKEAYVGTNLFYAEYEEYGTRYRAPHPFLRPAKLLVMRQKTKDEIKEMIDKELKLGKLEKGKKRVFD